jgi:hypothetical protein
MRRVTLWTILLTSSTVLMLFAASCTLKGTTNEITDTTSNVTVSTSGRTWFTEEGTLQPQHKLTAFTAFNQANLEQDLARGDGEYLTSLSALLGVTKDQQAAFHAKVQRDFDRLVLSDAEGRLQQLEALAR